MSLDPEVEHLIRALDLIATYPDGWSPFAIQHYATMASAEIRKHHPLPDGLPPTACEGQISVYDLQGEMW